jgi:hypothetical protein
MSMLINPRDVRVVRQAQQLELQVKKGLAVALSVHVTDLNGGQLRQCRNQIWKLQHSAVENSPEAKALSNAPSQCAVEN